MNHPTIIPDPWIALKELEEEKERLKSKYAKEVWEIDKQLSAILTEHFIPLNEYCTITRESVTMIQKRIRELPFSNLGIKVDGKYYVHKSQLVE